MTVSRRAILVALLLSAAGTVAAPAQELRLRPDVQARTDILTLADLVEGADGASARKPLFRAPALGENGTIQVNRIVDAASSLGIEAIDTGGRVQVLVSRAARRIGAAEIETALKRTLEARHGFEAAGMAILFDSGMPTLVVDPELKTPVVVDDLAYDPRARRFTATLSVTAASGGRRHGVRVSGTAMETIAVAVLNRAVARGETVQAADISVERRPRESAPADAAADAAAVAGRVARRAFSAGTMARVADFSRPEIIARNEMVTITYEIPGLILTLRGKALEAGGLGDTIAIQNLQSKRTMQGSVAAPGRVAVSGPLPGKIAANEPATTARR